MEVWVTVGREEVAPVAVTSTLRTPRRIRWKNHRHRRRSITTTTPSPPTIIRFTTTNNNSNNNNNSPRIRTLYRRIRSNPRPLTLPPPPPNVIRIRPERYHRPDGPIPRNNNNIIHNNNNNNNNNSINRYIIPNSNLPRRLRRRIIRPLRCRLSPRPPWPDIRRIRNPTFIKAALPALPACFRRHRRLPWPRRRPQTLRRYPRRRPRRRRLRQRRRRDSIIITITIIIITIIISRHPVIRSAAVLLLLSAAVTRCRSAPTPTLAYITPLLLPLLLRRRPLRWRRRRRRPLPGFIAAK